jgi:hypothetical protein
MKNKSMIAFLGIGIGMSLVAPVVAATCKSERAQCVETGVQFEECQSIYRRCLTLDRDECEI